MLLCILLGSVAGVPLQLTLVFWPASLRVDWCRLGFSGSAGVGPRSPARVGGLGYGRGVTLGKSLHLNRERPPACLPHRVLRGASGDKGTARCRFSHTR